MKLEPYINNYYSWTFSYTEKEGANNTTSAMDENLTFLGQFIDIFNQWGLAKIATIHYKIKINGQVSDSSILELPIEEKGILNQCLNELRQKLVKESKVSIEMILDGFIIGLNKEENLSKKILTITSENMQIQEFDINAHHISFLPCNPINGKKQHLIWKKMPLA